MPRNTPHANAERHADLAHAAEEYPSLPTAERQAEHAHAVEKYPYMPSNEQTRPAEVSRHLETTSLDDARAPVNDLTILGTPTPHPEPIDL